MCDRKGWWERMVERVGCSVEELMRILVRPAGGMMMLPSHAMDEVFPGIFIGEESSARDTQHLKTLGVTHVLNTALGKGRYHVNTNHVDYQKVGLVWKGIKATDMAQFQISSYFKETSEFITNAVKEKGKVLVHCREGVSRSSTVVLAFLMLHHHMTAQEALHLVRKSREICPNPGFLQQLCILNKQLWQSGHFEPSVRVSSGESRLGTNRYSSSEMEGWREFILDGIDQVPILGLPGTIIVYGRQALPILANRECEVLIAAAECGQGRVVLFPHDAYVGRNVFMNKSSSLTRLNQNILSWVTKGTYTEETQVLSVSEFTDSSVDEKVVLLWDTSAWISIEEQERLTRLVEEGGALVLGRCPWGYLQTHPGHTLSTMPMAGLLRKVGLAFDTKYYSSDNFVEVSENRATDCHLLKAICNNADLQCFKKCSQTICRSLHLLPNEIFQDMKEEVRETVTCQLDEVHCCPSPSKPIASTEGKALVMMMSRLILLDGQSDGRCCKVPSVATFPGDLSCEPAFQCFPLTVEGDAGAGCFIPTGCYLPAGHSLTVRVLSGSSPSIQPWSVAVGSHTDQLFNTQAPWRRWPILQVRKPLEDEVTSLYSPIGGLVYFITPENVASPLEVVIEDVIEAPYYDVTKPQTAAAWKERRYAPGLWADLVGEHMVVTVPAASVRLLDDPESVVRLWDEVVCGHYELCGLGRQGRRREWVVTDEQPRAGYMHAGYPMVTELDVAAPDCETSADVGLLCVEGLRRKGSWGMFHELGHNVQDPLWTFTGTEEVTCNIFTLHAMQTITNQKPWIHPWLKDHIPAMKQHFDSGANFNNWTSNPYIAIAIYAQLARDFGWGAYKKVFRHYRDMEASERPRTNEEKISCWIKSFSVIVEKNLCPVFEFWGFPISDKVRETLVQLPAFLFTDETTDMAPERHSDILEKYGLCQALEASV